MYSILKNRKECCSVLLLGDESYIGFTVLPGTKFGTLTSWEYTIKYTYKT